MIRFVFNEQKAAQAAARILRRHGEPMHRDKLVKLLYLADRRQLVERGIPITGAQFVSAPSGAELTEISRLLTSPSAEWSRYVVQAEDQCVRATPREDCSELSEYSCSLLDQICDGYAHRTAAELRRHSSQLCEWRCPDGAPVPVDLEQLLRAEGLNERQVSAVAEQLGAIHAFDAALRG